jgi:hypothetical protein
MVSITTISTITQFLTIAEGGGSIGGGGSVSTITQTVPVTDSWGGITQLSHGGGGISGSISGSGSVSGITKSVPVTQSGRRVADLSYCGGGDDSRGSITDLSYSGGGDNSGSSITQSVSVSAVVRSGVADLRHVGQRGGGVAQPVAVGAVAAVAQTRNSALFGFLFWFFSKDTGSDSHDDANLRGKKSIQR